MKKITIARSQSEKDDKEKSQRALYRFWGRYALLSFIATPFFLVLSISSYNLKWFTPIPFYLLTGLSFLLFIATQIAFRLIKKKWFNKFDKEDYSKAKIKSNLNRTNKIDKLKNRAFKYKLNLDLKGDIYLKFSELLDQFTKVQLNEDYLFYRIKGSVLNNSYIEAFYLPKKHENTLNFQTELDYLENLDKKINEYFANLGIPSNHIYLIVVLTVEKLYEDDINFFYSFPGYNEVVGNSTKLTTDINYNFCALELLSGQVFFFQGSSVDDGTEVNLDAFITKMLKLEKVNEN